MCIFVRISNQLDSNDHFQILDKSRGNLRRALLFLEATNTQNSPITENQKVRLDGALEKLI